MSAGAIDVEVLCRAVLGEGGLAERYEGDPDGFEAAMRRLAEQVGQGAVAEGQDTLSGPLREQYSLVLELLRQPDGSC